MTKKDAKWLVAGLLAFICLGFLFHQTQVASPKTHYEIAKRLSLLDQLDTTLVQDVLKLQSGSLLSYDPLVGSLRRLRTTYQELREGEYRITGLGQTDIDRSMEDLAEVLDRCEFLVEQYKTQHSVLRNSLSYLPRALVSLKSNLQVEDFSFELKQHLNQLTGWILLYQVGGRDDLHPLDRTIR